MQRNTSWLSAFGKASRPVLEDWGPITSLRTRYDDGSEVEFGIGHPTWTDLPADPGTGRVVTDGIRIIYDPATILRQHCDWFQGPA